MPRQLRFQEVFWVRTEESQQLLSKATMNILINSHQQLKTTRIRQTRWTIDGVFSWRTWCSSIGSRSKAEMWRIGSEPIRLMMIRTKTVAFHEHSCHIRIGETNKHNKRRPRWKICVLLSMILKISCRKRKQKQTKQKLAIQVRVGLARIQYSNKTNKYTASKEKRTKK